MPRAFEGQRGQVEHDRCPGAPPLDRAARLTFERLVGRLNTVLMAVAVETTIDFALVHATFCGHGAASLSPPKPASAAASWVNADCGYLYRGGQQALADVFTAVIEE